MTNVSTPGPWNAYQDDDGTWVRSVDDVIVCELDSENANDDVNLRDASLIAAAPELWAALKALMADIDAGGMVRDIARDGRPDWALEIVAFVQRLQSAQAAIAKAEGR